MANEPMQHKDLHGALFINTKKKRPEHPDRTGTCTIDGQKYRISGWIKTQKNGDAYLSLSFSIPTSKEDI